MPMLDWSPNSQLEPLFLSLAPFLDSFHSLDKHHMLQYLTWAHANPSTAIEPTPAAVAPKHILSSPIVPLGSPRPGQEY